MYYTPHAGLVSLSTRNSKDRGLLATISNATMLAAMGLSSMILPFFVRAIFVRTLGAEYLGVNSLFTSILTVLSLTEMGFSVAVGFSMYKAIAEDSAKTINALFFFSPRNKVSNLKNLIFFIFINVIFNIFLVYLLPTP